MPDGAPFPRHGSVPPQLFLPGGALKGEGAPYGLPAALFSCGSPCSGKNPLWGKRTEKEFSFAVFPCREAGRLIAYVCFLFPSCRSQRKALSVPARSMSGPPEKSLFLHGKRRPAGTARHLCNTPAMMREATASGFQPWNAYLPAMKKTRRKPLN